jgi:hypothetical protein
MLIKGMFGVLIGILMDKYLLQLVTIKKSDFGELVNLMKM